MKITNNIWADGSKQKFILLLLVLISLSGISQRIQSDKELLDSLIKNDDFIKQLDNESRSYFKVNFGIGNQLFSLHNRTLDAAQIEKKLIFTPSIGYYHKSGFNLSLSGYLVNDSGKRNFLFKQKNELFLPSFLI